MTALNNSTFPHNWVLIRGLIRSRFHWGSFPDKLKKELNLNSVQCVELLGNGYQHAMATPDKIETAISNLREQIKFPDAPIGLIGISLGGMLATKWTQLYPNEVSHLVLINSSSALSPFYKRLNPSLYAGIIKNLALNKPADLEKFILSVTSNKTELWLPLLKTYIEFQKTHPVSLSNFIKQLNLTSQVDFTQTPQSKNLILTSRADRLANFKCSETIAREWACDIRYHETSGHDLTLDDADLVIDQIRDLG